ncbi:MAG: hypothetical protein KIY11_03075 [Thermoplasmata archaeon]|nr:hypothetical protein [Candidatus Sysuiplasma acidicola]
MKELAEGRQIVKVDGKLTELMVRKFGEPVPLHVKVIMVQGPCRDDWCQMLQKPVADFITGKVPPGEVMHVSFSDKTEVYIDKSLYESAYRNRETIMLDAGLRGNVKVRLVNRRQKRPLR